MMFINYFNTHVKMLHLMYLMFQYVNVTNINIHVQNVIFKFPVTQCITFIHFFSLSYGPWLTGI